MADYLPTSIKNLNTLLGDQLLDGGGGGGSSDFTKAVVSLTFTKADQRLTLMTITSEDPEKIVGFVLDDNTGIDISLPDAPIEFDTSEDVTCYITTGDYIIFYSLSVIDGTAFAVTGNAEVIPGDDEMPALIKVTGDCTITYK